MLTTEQAIELNRRAVERTEDANMKLLKVDPASAMANAMMCKTMPELMVRQMCMQALAALTLDEAEKMQRSAEFDGATTKVE